MLPLRQPHATRERVREHSAPAAGIEIHGDASDDEQRGRHAERPHEPEGARHGQERHPVSDLGDRDGLLVARPRLVQRAQDVGALTADPGFADPVC